MSVKTRVWQFEAEALAALAKKNDRSVAAELRVAIREHIARQNRETK